ncbi:MAG: DNA polymerase III subunit delta' [Clostridia bacterium]|jgi:DNA polymerase-3 subunit delta'|nr:DNA polymerase III subunit delta' [Clostridia bacterium]
MAFTEIIGQEKAVGLLQKALATGRIAHSYIFCGPSGVGKNRTAQVFARSLNCTDPRDGAACGICSACQKALAGNHPDILCIVPDGTAIKIGQIREVQEKASFKHYEGAYKVIILDEADKLTAEAANSLLKILEEPPVQTVFILLAEELSRLPVTVASRCQVIPFKLLEKDALERILTSQGISVDFPLGLAGGSAGKAAVLHQGAGTNRLVNEVEQLLEDLRRGGYRKILAWAEIWEKNKERIGQVLEILSWYYRDRICERAAGAGEVILDTLPAKDYRIEECYSALEKINKAFYHLKYKANVKLALEVLLLDLRQIEQNNQ